MQNRYSLVNDATKRENKMAVREEEVVRPHVCAPKLVIRMVTAPQQSWGTWYDYLTDPHFALSYP
jgi:hypothetical protein